MSVINDRIPTHQLFTSPELVIFIWSLHPKTRNNDIYKVIMSLFDTRLEDITWAKTGLKYDQTTGTPDQFKKAHTDYSNILRADLLDQVQTRVLSDSIDDLKIFNMKSLERTIDLMKSNWYVENKDLEEMILWIASLSVMIETYNVSNDNKISYEGKFSDISSYVVYLNNYKEYLKKFY